MAWWRRVAARLFGFRRDADIADELRTHLEMAAEGYRAQGMEPEEARRRATREFGNVANVRRATREVWSRAWLEHLAQDVTFGARILWQAPGVSLAAIALTATVIGGNATVFSIVRMMLTNPATGVHAPRLAVVASVRPTTDEPSLSYPAFLDVAAAVEPARPAAGWATERLTVAVDGVSYAVFGALVTAGYFDTFGLRAQVGRTLTTEDAAPAARGLPAVVSARFWRERLHGTDRPLGRTLTVNGQPALIVGVAADGFRGALLTPGEDVWLPLAPFYAATGNAPVLSDRAQPLVLMAAPLAPDATIGTMQARLSTVAAQLAAAYPDAGTDQRFVASAYSATALLPVSRMAAPFLAVLGAITLLTLIIVSANVANLMLVRALERQREIAVRQAMGATRGRVVRLLVAEGLAVASVAGAVAAAVAWGLSRVLIRTVGPDVPGALDAFAPDWRVVAYAMTLALVAAVLFTAAPGVRTWRQPVLPWLKAGNHSVAPGRSRVTSALVITQLAFSVVLLTSAGLAYRSVSLLDTAEVGFAPDRLLFVTVRLNERAAFVDRAISPSERAAAFAKVAEIRDRVLSDGRVEAATYVRRIPGAYRNAGIAVRTGDVEALTALRRPVGPSYLDVLGLRPRLGRDIEPSDVAGRPRVAVVNQELADALWPGLSPLGRLVTIGATEAAQVVGVAPNALFDGPSREVRPRYVFVPEQQATGDPPMDSTLLIRYRGSLEGAVDAAGQAVAAVDPAMPIALIATMNTRLALVTELERTIARLLVVFAALSLGVALAGVYAITAFNARRRVRDFGVRLALGASPRQVQREVLREAARLAALGLGVGSVLSVLCTAGLARAWLSVTPTDPLTHAGVAAVLAVTTVVSALLPARHAGRVDVVQALRQE